MKRATVGAIVLAACLFPGRAPAAAPDPTAPPALTPDEAAAKTGIDLGSGHWTATYSADLRAWFFVDASRAAVALHWEVPPTAPMGYFKWRRRDLPPMDPGVPATLDLSRAMVLLPEVFGDDVAARPQPEATPLTAGQIWMILARAAKGGWGLRLEPDPAGAGVRVALLAQATPPRPPPAPLPRQ